MLDIVKLADLDLLDRHLPRAGPVESSVDCGAEAGAEEVVESVVVVLNVFFHERQVSLIKDGMKTRMDSFNGQIISACLSYMFDINKLLQQLRLPDLRPNSLRSLNQLFKATPSFPRPLYRRIITTLLEVVDEEDEGAAKVNLLSSVTELLQSHRAHIEANDINLVPVINCLGSQTNEVRRSMHNLSVSTIKLLRSSDQVFRAYTSALKRDLNTLKLQQKIIQSLQGIAFSYEKCFFYLNDSSIVEDLVQVLFVKLGSDTNNIRKFSEQTILAFIKNAHFSRHARSFSQFLKKRLTQISAKFGLESPIPQCLQQKQLVIEEIKIPNHEQGQLSKSPSFSPERLSLEEPIDALLNQLQPSLPWYLKCEKIEELQKFLNRKDSVFPKRLYGVLIPLVTDQNFKVSLTCLTILEKLLSEFTPSQDVKPALINVVIEKMGDPKAVLRNLSIKIVKTNLQDKQWVDRLVEQSRRGSITFKQQYIQLCGQSISQRFLREMLGGLCSLVEQQKTKIKIRCIQTLVLLANKKDKIKLLIQGNLNNVYYQLFLQRFNNSRPQESIPLSLQPPPRRPHHERRELEATMEPRCCSLKSKEDNIFSRDGRIIQAKNNYKTFNTLKTANTSNIGAEQAASSYSAFGEPFLSTKYSKALQTDIQFKTGSLQSEQKRGQSPLQEIKTSKHQEQVRQKRQIKRLTEEQDQQRDQKEKIRFPLKPNLKRNSKALEIQLEQENLDKHLALESKEYSVKKEDDKELRRRPLKKQKDQDSQREAGRFSLKRKQKAIPQYKAAAYLAIQQLQPLEKPQSMLKQFVNDIRKEDDWERQFEAINGLRVLALHHSSSLSSNQTAMSMLLGQVIKLIDSLRSSLSKNAMICVGQLVQSQKKVIDSMLQSILLKLFHKAQDANAFIGQQVRKCFISLSMNSNIARLVTIFQQHIQHKATSTKVHIALCLQKIIQKNNQKLLSLKQFPKILSLLGLLLTEASIQVRAGAKKVVMQLLRRVQPRSELISGMKKVLNQSQLQKVRQIERQFQKILDF